MLLNKIEEYLSIVDRSLEVEEEMVSVRDDIASLIKESGMSNKHFIEVLGIGRSTFQQKLSGLRGWKSIEILLILQEIKKGINQS